MRKTCIDMVYELAKQDERVVFVGSDLGAGTLKDMQQEMPERFFMEGVNEANIIGMCSGLATEGYIVYANTIATFFARRAYEQVCLDLGHADLPVRLICNGGGLVYAPLGPTHEAIDDLALMRSIPNMTVVSVADADEMRAFMPQSLDWPHPIYIRLAKGHDPIVTEPTPPFELGKGRAFAEGGDALVVTTGIGLRLARPAVEALRAEGIDVGLLHLPTVKPLDTEAILERASKCRAVVTVEEHSVVGGLGSAVASLLLQELAHPPRFRIIGIPDKFPDIYGSQADQLEHFDITPERVTLEVRSLLTDAAA
jgi:transketolase